MVISLKILIIFVALSIQPVQAELIARLSSNYIDELESVQLTIRATDTRAVEELDLSSLEKDFQVINTNTSSQYQYINGREQSWVDYQITLKPRKTGSLLIPGIKIGNSKSETARLQVKPISDTLRKEINQLVFFEIDISKTEVYLQEQLILTRRLIYSNGVQLYNEIPGAPEIDNAVILTLGETKSGTTQRNGKKYGVVEQTYAIFPELSGAIEIPSVNITASVRLAEQGRISRKGVRVDTQAIKVTVKPIPPTFPAEKTWLPAQSVILSQSFDPRVTKNINVGDTLDRRIQIRIDGNTGSILPKLASDLPYQTFREYPQNPEIQDDTAGESVIGFRTEVSSILPLIPGNHIINAETITWWDTISDEIRVSRLEEKPINVVGQISFDVGNKNQNIEPEPLQQLKEEDSQSLVGKTLTAAFSYLPYFLGILVVLALVWVGRRLPQRPKRLTGKNTHLRELIRTSRQTKAETIKQPLDKIFPHLESAESKAIYKKMSALLNGYLFTSQTTERLNKDDSVLILNLAQELKRSFKDRSPTYRYTLPDLYNN